MKIVKPTVVFLREFAPGNPLELINQAARTCYKSEGEAVEMFQRVIASGHTSTIEHVQLSFRIVADRGVLNELVRHRIGASYCLSGDTVLPGMRRKTSSSYRRWTIKKLFEYQNNSSLRGNLRNLSIRSVDANGVIVPGKIKTVIYSGEQELFEVVTVSGRNIKATMKHRFLTPEGYKRLEELSVGDRLTANGLPAWANKEWIEQKYITEALSRVEVAKLAGVCDCSMGKAIRALGIKKSLSLRKNRKGGHGTPGMHSEASKKKLSEIHKGDLNPQWKGAGVGEGGARLRTIKTYKAESCWGCRRTDALERHHMDKIPWNNSSGNVKVLCPKCHKAFHHQIGALTVFSDQIVSITSVGVEPTYDIEMASEPHNFVANGLVVHNSQESTRYCNYGKAKFGHEITVIKPDDIVAVPEADSVWTEVVEHIEQGYMRLLDIGIKPQIARSLLPLGLKSEVVVSMNIRSLRHFLGLRMAAAAHPQMREIADEVYARVREYCPVLVEGLALPLKEQPAKAKELRSVYSAEGYKLEDDLGQIHKYATAAAVAEYHGVDSVSREDLRTICALHGRRTAVKLGLRWAGASCSDAEPVPARPPAGCPAPEHSVLVTDTDGKQRWKHVQDVGPGDVLVQVGLAPAGKPAEVKVPKVEVYGFYDDTDCVVVASTGTVLELREIPALSFGGQPVSLAAGATARSRTSALAVAHGGTYAGVQYCPGIREIYEQDPLRFRDLARDLLRDGTDEKASEAAEDDTRSREAYPFTKITRKAGLGTVGEVSAWADELCRHHDSHTQLIAKTARDLMTERRSEAEDDAREVDDTAEGDEPVAAAPDPGTVPVGPRGPAVYTFYDDTHYVVISSDNKVLELCEVTGFQPPSLIGVIRACFLAKPIDGLVRGSTRYDGLFAASKAMPPEVFGRTLLNTVDDRHTAPAPEPATIPATEQVTRPTLYGFYDERAYVLITGDRVLVLAQAVPHGTADGAAERLCRSNCEKYAKNMPAEFGAVYRYQGLNMIWHKANIAETLGETLRAFGLRNDVVPVDREVYGFYDATAYVLVDGAGTVLETETGIPAEGPQLFEAERRCNLAMARVVQSSSGMIPVRKTRVMDPVQTWMTTETGKRLHPGATPREWRTPGLEVYAFYDTDNYVLVNGQGTVLESGAVVYRKAVEKTFHAAEEVVGTAMQVWKHSHPESKLMPAVIVTLPVLNWKSTDTGKTLAVRLGPNPK